MFQGPRSQTDEVALTQASAPLPPSTISGSAPSSPDQTWPWCRLEAEGAAPTSRWRTAPPRRKQHGCGGLELGYRSGLRRMEGRSFGRGE
jgi:hypothetical protein